MAVLPRFVLELLDSAPPLTKIPMQNRSEKNLVVRCEELVVLGADPLKRMAQTLVAKEVPVNEIPNYCDHNFLLATKKNVPIHSKID